MTAFWAIQLTEHQTIVLFIFAWAFAAVFVGVRSFKFFEQELRLCADKSGVYAMLVGLAWPLWLAGLASWGAARQLRRVLRHR
jgi:hypothetical protein